MPMGEKQKKLRQWFQRHGWHTSNTPTGTGFFLESPVENMAGLLHLATDKDTGEKRMFCWEHSLSMELDRFGCGYVSIYVYNRRHWWKKDNREDLGYRGFDWVPSDDFEDWLPNRNGGIRIPAKDIIQLAELIKAAQEDWEREHKRKHHSYLLERKNKTTTPRWIGVNTNYDTIKWEFSNERIRQELKEKSSLKERTDADAKS